MPRGRGFAEMVLYIEACESGSIFQGMLDESLPVYAVTAANALESSWGCAAAQPAVRRRPLPCPPPAACC